MAKVSEIGLYRERYVSVRDEIGMVYYVLVQWVHFNVSIIGMYCLRLDRCAGMNQDLIL